MGLKRQRDLAMRLGEFPVKTGENIYGGSPIGVDENGELVLAKADQLNGANGDSTTVGYIGIAYTSYTDALNFTREKIIAVLAGPGLFTFIQQSENDINQDTAGIPGDDFPFDESITDWQPGDKLYISNTGFWTNVQANADDPYYGIVRAYSSNELEVFLYSGPAWNTVDNS